MLQYDRTYFCMLCCSDMSVCYVAGQTYIYLPPMLQYNITHIYLLCCSIKVTDARHFSITSNHVL